MLYIMYILNQKIGVIMTTIIGNQWDDILEKEFASEKFNKLSTFLDTEYSTKTIFPPREDIFKALKLTPYNDVKVVILGQDPYHNHNQAHGLSFSVTHGTKIPPSLKNIFKEINSDTAKPIPTSGDLTYLATQGVLLLNATLTVVAHTPNSHSKIGWQEFSDTIISKVNELTTPVVFILWGANAQSKAKLIDTNRHLILESPHPSPLSSYRGFFNSAPFSKTNAFLELNKRSGISW